MTADNSIELARDDGPEFRSVRLALEESGALLMDAQDMGPNVRKTFDEGDYEFWVRVGREGLSKLAFELLKDRFAGRIDAVDELRRYCQERGIAHEFDSWV
ncbi:MAG TPA: hypothetical protein VGF56_17385 [Rhizomicrobium sp.]|jgi:hypothetical protein